MSKPEKPAGKVNGGDPITSQALKVAGAAAAGITATGFVIIVGAALFWFRFDEVGLPATQAIGLLSRNELLVQGAQEVALYLGIALVAVLLVFFADKGAEVKDSTRAVLSLLAAGAVVYLFTTGLDFWYGLGLAVLVVSLLRGCIEIGRRTDKRFWPLALAVFVATLVFAGATSILIVKEQDYVQAVAVLRGDDDAGMTGVYVTATDDTIYVGEVVAAGSEEEPDEMRRAIFDVPRAGATYAVGPLESVPKAERRAEAMLFQLISDRDRVRPPAGGAAAPAKPGGEAKATGQAPSIEAVLKAFGSASVTIHDGPLEKELCLVRYADASRPTLVGNWWTSCRYAKRLVSVADIREKLALPGRFQSSYDARIEAKVPAGTVLAYVEGRVAKQCEHDPPDPCGRVYAGGGWQYYLPQPGEATPVKKECATTREDEAPNWTACGT